MALTPGTRLGPYEIESLIGSGGMGEVYKAHDRRLQRTVAIKRMIAGDQARFESEARAIAAISHPHICQIYDVGPDYLVLEYLEGEPLRGPVAAGEAIQLAAQIADALDAAHERGILHRDLKPANVMVLRQGGTAQAKLLDFGIARLTEADADKTRTLAGELIGTPAYMSPEQASGGPLDARSDVFSYGAVLYELLSGERAFTGDSTAQVLTAVLRDDPRPFQAPPALRQIVTRCLAKDPARRFQSMAEVRQALRQMTRPAADAAASIAVLPFANLSADPENEYFGDGLAEEIINALAQVERLKVIARTSAFSFKGKHEDVRSIAQALGVTNVLEGSVRRAGDRIRVTAQLIAASDGTHLWSERYDRPMTDVFAMQDEIAHAITAALKLRLGGPPAAARAHTPQLEAYEAFLRGRAHLIHFTPDAWNRANGYFEQAIALDPAYADPHAELALGHFICGMHGIRPMHEVAPHVRAEVERALALNPADQRPRFLLGAIAAAHDYDWAAAETHFAASMNATDVSAHARWIYASLFLRAFASFGEAAAEMGRAVQQDPLNATWHAIMAAHLIDAGRLNEALEEGRRGIELEPNYFVAHHLLGETYWFSGRRDEAAAAFERTYELSPWNANSAGWLAAMLWLRGDEERARRIVDAMGDSPSPPWGRVAYHLLTGDLDSAADWYERMIAHRDPFAIVYAKSRIVEPLRRHARWPELAALMNLPESPSPRV
jgi:TolB-like protein/tRNA A-37 threonylcarbamoyl transferase component Bud32